MFVVATEPVKDGNNTVGSVQVTKSITITSGKVTYKAAGRFTFNLLNLSPYTLIHMPRPLSNKRPFPINKKNVTINVGM